MDGLHPYRKGSNPTRRRFLHLIFCSALTLSLTSAALHAQPAEGWRAATSDELKSVIPARAPVISERIETEFRTASGITDGTGHFIAGVVMITAGYSAEGKYSHYFLVQAPMRAGSVDLPPGEYVFGWTRSQDALKVSFYQAATGKEVGQVDAVRNPAITRVESFRIWPPRGTAGEPHSVIQIGRFSFPYSLTR
ncbi:MAG TPA: hypothetical protein VGM02_03475 [Acidobacteriaceae bacterium]